MANAKAIFQDGGTRTTRIGYINKNWQICLGHRGRAYMMVCLKCGFQYGSHPGDVFQRKCPSNDCDSGTGENWRF